MIILDTLKKFTDLMNKKASSEFGKLARTFVGAGGTIIALAHTNKNKDEEGKGVTGGCMIYGALWAPGRPIQARVCRP